MRIFSNSVLHLPTITKTTPIPTREDTTIDLDGPGPLPPFSVTCYKSSKGFVTAVRSPIPILSTIWQPPSSWNIILLLKAWQRRDDESGRFSGARLLSSGNLDTFLSHHPGGRSAWSILKSNAWKIPIFTRGNYAHIHNFMKTISKGWHTSLQTLYP